MIEYLAAAFTAAFLGFLPLTEFYVAVPAGMAMGLSAPSAALWTILGNFLPAVMIHSGFEAIERRWPRFTGWLHRRVSDRWRGRLETGGLVWVFVLLPIVGTWATSAAVKGLGLSRKTALLWPLLAIIVYSAATAALIAAGVDLFWRED
jgi:uncharacterized membrane protein